MADEWGRMMELALQGPGLGLVSPSPGVDADFYAVRRPMDVDAWAVDRLILRDQTYELAIENGPVGASLWLYRVD
jgi:hypothetical protein